MENLASLKIVQVYVHTLEASSLKNDLWNEGIKKIFTFLNVNQRLTARK